MKITLITEVNDLQLGSIQKLIETLPWSHHADIVVRKDGADRYFEADWLKGMQISARDR